MKIDRLIGILSILLQNEKIIAPYLAKKFEVSRRTINRDIEDLCKAGIPIITLQGSGGGISISDSYKIDKTLLTLKERDSILAGLSSLDSISDHPQYKQLMEKLGYNTNSKSDTIYDTKNHIIINLSSHNKNSLAPKITMIQTAIEEKRIVSFQYYNYNGESERMVEPYLLVFEWGNWYVWSFCTKSMDFRMFKLNRIQNIQLTEEQFIPRNLPSYKENAEQYFNGAIHFIAKFDVSAKWRLIDAYGIDCYKELNANELLFEWDFSNQDYLLQWILSFGDQITILEPPNIQNEYLAIIKNIKIKYDQT